MRVSRLRFLGRRGTAVIRGLRLSVPRSGNNSRTSSGAICFSRIGGFSSIDIIKFSLIAFIFKKVSMQQLELKHLPTALLVL
jgi:hypothetical protein